MTETPNIESDPFFQLLTDALRAGPGSAQWGDAVARLREGGVEGADEYKLILRAREDIESGRDYRAVRPGPGFTRKVLDGIERDGGTKPGVSMATVIAVVSGLVMLGVVIAAAVLFTGGDPKSPQQLALERLEATSFSVAAGSLDFTANAAAPVSPGMLGWRTIGQLAFEPGPGLKAAAAPQGGQGVFFGGGLVTSDPLPADRAGFIEAEIALPSTATDTGSAQVFVSDSPDFSPDRATSPREVVWIYREGRVTVDANGRSQGEGVDVGGGGAAGQTLKVRITFDRDVAIVESGGRRHYAGPHGLQPDAPRYVGVRFIRAAGEAGESATIRAVNVSQSAAPAAAAGGAR